MALIFDSETNGLLDSLTTIHCLWIEDTETGERSAYTDARYPCDGTIAEGVERLTRAQAEGIQLVGHNIIKFDIPAINKLYPGAIKLTIDEVGRSIIDTLVCSRLIWADVRESDTKQRDMPGKLKGTHRLAAWGWRLGERKGDYGDGVPEGTDIWASWNPEMHDYCGQDVAVTGKLWASIQAKQYAPEALLLEHEFAFLMALMEENGFGFDEHAASELYVELVKRRAVVATQLQEHFPPERIVETKLIKANNKTKGWVKGGTREVVTTVEFNPSSRQQIARRLQALGWEPEEFTDNGQPKVDETVLASIYHSSAGVLSEHFLIEKRIGQIAEGKQAWLKLHRKGVMHGSINPNGAVTGRCTHSHPNISQVPKVGSPMGADCRACFRPTRKGWKQVGIDLSGLELRCLSHFMSAYDGGAYGRILLEGDIHWANVLAMGLASGDSDDSTRSKIVRNGAKTFIYAFLYGAGDRKAGTTVYDIILALKDAGIPHEQLQLKYFGHLNPPAEADFRKAGKTLKRSFLKKTPAIAQLREVVAAKVKAQGFLRGLDGRRLRIRSAHSALNALLQSAGALIAKKAAVIAFRTLEAAGLKHGRDWALMAHVHDEMQIECKPHLVQQIGELVVNSMQQAGVAFKFRIPITGEHKHGDNWRDCH